MIYKNYIGEPATTTSLTTMPGQLDEQRYIYLNAGEPTLIKYL
jgi:hypothetical protein